VRIFEREFRVVEDGHYQCVRCGETFLRQEAVAHARLPLCPDVSAPKVFDEAAR
jgi:hypothetical protein